ncbi:response regulator, partial [bacterium]|nr:response regulator [bacterium]MBU1635239.1 response regulator [bacterium]
MPKILIIDAKQGNLSSVKALLQDLIPDCQVYTAQSGKKGHKIARKEQPDTILLDISMPEMDGYTVCEKLKEDGSTKHIPV